MKKENELHLTCSCHSHELHIEKDHEDDMWYMSFWQRGYISENSWKYKLKCIWQILKHGRPYGDEIVLEKKELEELKQYVDGQLAPTSTSTQTYYIAYSKAPGGASNFP